MQSGRLTTTSSRQERIVFGVALRRIAIHSDDIASCVERLLETAASKCNAFSRGRMPRTRGSLRGGFCGQAQRRDCVIAH